LVATPWRRHAKDEFHSRLSVPEPGPGFVIAAAAERRSRRRLYASVFRPTDRGRTDPSL
jgi:hypothetical protein